MLDLKQTIQRLKESERRSEKEGYEGDAANHAFKRHLLILLSQKRKKQKPSAWNLFVAQYLKQGKTIQDAARDWKK